jgi:putative DNA primase/helicase
MSVSWPTNVRPLPVTTAVAQERVAVGDVGTVAGLNPEVHRSQLRIALRLAAAEQGRLLHIPGLGWHGWDGSRWALDPGERVAKQSVMRAVRNARLQASSMRSAQDREDLWRDAKSCETSPGIRGVLELGAALAELSALPGELDINPHLLNTPGGTLDLSTGRTHPCLPADLLTKVTGCPYEGGGGGSAWDTFLVATLPDAEVRLFLQRVVGLALIGKVIEHVLPILTGTGRNGKGTFVRTVAAALGSYAIEAEPDLFMARERAHPTGQLDLRGVRLATCQETDDGRRLDVAAVKRLTGGDTIRARKMRQDFIEFTPSHLPFLITNHLPKVPADDPALWARLLVIPFDQSFLGREDRGLEDRLVAELPSVLAWAVAGWQDYRGRGRLDPPAAVSDATSTYRIRNDAIAGFIDDRCLLNPHMHVISSDLWSQWETWCHANAQPPGTNRMLKAAMEARGITLSRSNGRSRFQGIALASAQD